MSEVPLYPWVIERTIYFLKAFDERWFEETDAGLVPKDQAD